MKLDRITIDPNRMNGQPCIRDLRLTVRRVLEILATYPDWVELQAEYPELEREDVQEALIYAATSLDKQVIEVNHLNMPRYEEAKLNLKFVKKIRLTEYPFDYTPRYLEKLTGEVKEDWNVVGCFTFILTSNHPDKGEYVAYESDMFYIFPRLQEGYFKFPTVVGNQLVFQPKGQVWVDGFFRMRSHSWKQINTFLIQDNWIGITENAVKRIPPFNLQPPNGWQKEKGWIENSGYFIYSYSSRTKIEEIDIEKLYLYQRILEH